MRLDPVQCRVVGSLIEKQLTTPQQYPLSLNALLAACNQSSNRDPVVSFTEHQVGEALEQLKGQHLVRFVLPSHGRSVVRYRQVLDEVLGLGPPELALLAVLLLRGPQTPGELRARTERMADLGSPAGVESELGRMAAMETPLVAALPRRPGHKEMRWRTVLAEHEATPDGTSPDATPPADPLAGLRAEVAALAEAVEALRADLEALRANLGG